MLVRCGIRLDEMGILKVGRRKNVRLHGKSRQDDDVQAIICDVQNGSAIILGLKSSFVYGSLRGGTV